MSTTLTFGSYSFSPVPFIDLNKTTQRNPEGRIVDIYNMRLIGKLSTGPTMSGGITNVVTLQNNLRNAMISGNKLELKCNSTILLTCYPKVGEINFAPTNDNWVYTTDYTIELTFEDFAGEDNSPYLSGFSETWNVEFTDPAHYNINMGSFTDSNPYFLSVSHNLEATGIEHFVSGTGVTGTKSKDAWEYARDWVLSKLGFVSGEVQQSGVLNLNLTNLGVYNHMRVVNKNEYEGTYNVQENWLVAASGSGCTMGAVEDYSVEITKQHDTDMTSVSVNGQIQGLETRNYGTGSNDFSITTTKISSASGYWNTVKANLYTRAQHFSSGETSRSLNTIPLNNTVGYSTAQGLISYQYAYDDRPSTCISGAKYEQIDITDNLPRHSVAIIPIIGRGGAGPILQDINNVSERTRTISVECVVAPSTGCTAALLNATNPKSNVKSIICSFQQELTGAYDQVFIADDSESWQPRTGRYSRSVTYLLGKCSGGGIDNVCT